MQKNFPRVRNFYNWFKYNSYSIKDRQYSYILNCIFVKTLLSSNIFLFKVIRNFFGIVFAALYKVKDKKTSLKHFMVFEEAKIFGTDLLQQAFHISLQITVRAPIMHDLESRILNLCQQVW